MEYIALSICLIVIFVYLAIVLFQGIGAITITIFSLLFPIICIFIFCIILLRFSSGLYINYKKIQVENANFILVENRTTIVIPKNIEKESNQWSVSTVRPQLNKINYGLEWIENRYLLNDIDLPKANTEQYYKIWQEIAKLYKEILKIDLKNSQSKIKITQCHAKKNVANFSNVYSKYSEQYEQLILQLENETRQGVALIEKTNQLIREHLIGINLSEINNLHLVNELENSKWDRKNTESELEDRYNSLRAEVDIHLNTVDELSNFFSE